MAAEAELVSELMAIPGVADADVAPDSPEGVKVTLSQGADATGVAAAVRDVLAKHGLRSRMAPPQDRIVPDVPPPPPSNVVPGPGLVQTTIVPPPDASGRQPGRYDEPAAVLAEAAQPPPEPEERTVEDVRAEPVRPPAESTELMAVRIEERRDGVSVTVETADGTLVTKPGRATDSGVNEAVVAAVGEASGVVPAPVLLEVGEADLGGRTVVTVVLQRPDGSMLVGSSLVGAEKAFAVARATWAAILEA